jgi:hypothetical protein
LKAGAKVTGTTIAELGNRNRPLDMLVYEKDGKPFLLIANSARGVMKVPADGLDKATAVEQPVRGGTGTAGVKYETVADLKGVEQLAKLDDQHAVVLMREGGAAHLKTIALP